MAERNSDLSEITASARNIPDDSVDCGIRALGWCRGAYCQKYARLRTFIIVLACAGIFQGACESYFRVTAKEAALENSFDPLVVDWLLVSSGIFQAIFALVFAYWAHRLHPVSWLGGSIMLQAALCIISMIPLIYNFANGKTSTVPATDASLCEATSIMDTTQAGRGLTPEQNKLVILIMLFLLQFALALGALAYYTIGIIYIDDNSQSIDSPAVIATTLGARIFGLQIGSLLVLGVGEINIGWWLGWAMLAVAVFVSGLLLSLYPKRLPKTVIHQAAQRIIEESRTHQFGSQFSTYIDDTDFKPSVKRVLGNKLLMFNLVSIMFIQAASVNYMYQEESYLQSRFYLPYSEEDGLLQEWRAHFVAYFLKPPVAAVAMLVGGLVIAKLKLRGRTITGINIALNIHLLLIYVVFIFLKCDVGPIAGVQGGKLQQPYCSAQCSHSCTPNVFQPVCPENSTVTYFSPCYAGCTMKTTISNIELYEGCTCGMNYEHTWTQVRASAGSCSADKCNKMLIIFQVLSLTAAALLGVTLIGKIMITLRCVLPQDKALALATEVMIVGLFTYVPTHLAYDVVTRTTCIFWAPHYSKCLLRETPKHGNILNILTASLILLGIFFDILVFIFVKGLNLYNCKVTDNNYTPSLYAPIPHEESTIVSGPMTTQTTIAGSPVATTAAASHAATPQAQRQEAQPLRPAPKPIVNVFRNPSSLTNSSAGEQSLEPGSTADGVTYAQVVFPPDKKKPTDGTASPKRMAVRADVPLHHLSAQDVRTQLQGLKSFQPATQETGIDTVDIPPLTVNVGGTAAVSTPAVSPAVKVLPLETDFDAKRPQSPETDF